MMALTRSVTYSALGRDGGGRDVIGLKEKGGGEGEDERDGGAGEFQREAGAAGRVQEVVRWKMRDDRKNCCCVLMFTSSEPATPLHTTLSVDRPRYTRCAPLLPTTDPHVTIIHHLALLSADRLPCRLCNNSL